MASGSYKHIFFDLDHTIWDFDSNSALTLAEMYKFFRLDSLGFESTEEFITRYKQINDEYWSWYRQGRVSKDQLRTGRFRDTLMHVEHNDEVLANELNEFYVTHSPHKTQLLPHAEEVLKYLCTKYVLHLITNGFKEVQYIKISQSGLEPYFQEIIISEEVGYQKPDPMIFVAAMERASATKDECLMIGDSFEADILGAHRAGIDSIYFNPKGEVSSPAWKQIRSLRELMDLL